MKAINDRVIIQLGIMPERIQSGLFLPNVAVKDGQAKVNLGKVISAGDGLTLRSGEFIPVKVKAGDVVIWEQYGGILFEVLGENVVCVRSEDIGGVLEPSEYEGWEFDPEVYHAREKAKQAELEEKKKQIDGAQENSAEQRFNGFCVNENCSESFKIKHKFGKNVSAICEECGQEMKADQEQRISPIGHTPMFHAPKKR